MRVLPIIALGLLAGCATTPGGAPVAEQSITYRTQPCFGTCPAYQVRVDANGEGVFEGRRHTAVSGERRFTLTPAQFEAFRATLAPARPQGHRRLVMGEPGCKTAPTDMPSIEVEWTDRQASRLDAYTGCRRGNESLFRALEAAPAVLPIGELVGRR